MFNFAIILLAVFSTSMADVCQTVACTRSNAIAEIDSLVNEIKTQYDKYRSDFIKYNEPTLAEAAQYNKTYHDQIKADFETAEDALIVPHVHVFPACQIVYDQLLPYKGLVEGILNDCISGWRGENAKYLDTLDMHWSSFNRDILVAKSTITEIGKTWLNGTEIEIESEGIIDRIKNQTKLSIASIREDIRDKFVKPSRERNSLVQPEIDMCLQARQFGKMRQSISDMIGTIDKCVSTERQRHLYKH